MVKQYQEYDSLLRATDNFSAKISTSYVVSNSSRPNSVFIPKQLPKPLPLSDIMTSLPLLLSLTSPNLIVATLSSFQRCRQQFEVNTTTILRSLLECIEGILVLCVDLELASACLDQQSMQFYYLSKNDLLVFQFASFLKIMNSLFIWMVDRKIVFWRQLLKSPRIASSLSLFCRNLQMFSLISQSSFGIKASNLSASSNFTFFSLSNSSALFILMSSIQLLSQWHVMQALAQSDNASLISLLICTSSFENMLIIYVMIFPLKSVISFRYAFQR